MGLRCSFQEPKSLLHIDATIFVCETDLAYGIGRMLKVLNVEHLVEYKNIFLFYYSTSIQQRAFSTEAANSNILRLR